MSRIGPIIVAEQDVDESILMKEAFDSLGIRNKLLFFTDGAKVLEYLRTTPEQPFLIISEVRLAGMDGLELKKEINSDEFLRQKSIPFIFFTANSESNMILEAYKSMVQGYFKKEKNFRQIQNMVRMIVEYWLVCRHPNSSQT
jgi:CheY-like chemotaxis protein